jgi:hypothetical protein
MVGGDGDDSLWGDDGDDSLDGGLGGFDQASGGNGLNDYCVNMEAFTDASCEHT